MASDLTIMTRAVMPSMANYRGVLFGGMLMEWMDEVAGIAAKRYTGTEVTTVAVEQMKFLKLISVGEFVELAGKVEGVGNTSLRIRVGVRMDSDSAAPIAEAVFVYVALDEHGKPRAVRRE